MVKLPLRHAGQYADSETGLFYNYFRFYDPRTGRYVTSDPIGLQGGMNTYGYVGGSPLRFVDPDGQWAILVVNPYTIAIGAAVVGSIACYITDCEQAVGNAAGAAIDIGTTAQNMSMAVPIIVAVTIKEYCSDDPRCNELEEAVRKAKDNIGNKYRGGKSVCTSEMTYYQIKQRSDDWLKLAEARAQRDKVCFGGGDLNHQIEQSTAWKQVAKCQNYMKQSF